MSITIFIITSSIYASKPVVGGEFSFWQYGVRNSGIHTNWLGIIALGNSVASLLGFFLFSEKQHLNALVSSPKRIFKWIADGSSFNKIFVLTLFLLLFFILFAASRQGLIKLY